ncbi:MAG TPA: sigma-70 family RNA polymerase sigma factor [Planctomycetota bacterium]|nr:sigma-70 family RNA polymerase sigma factor [Planctomycetota bacterium]
MNSSSGDLELPPERWSLYRQGNPAVFAELAHHYAPLVSRFLMRVHASAADAEDLLQDALLKAFEKRAEYDPARSFRTWLISIAINCGRDRERVRRGRLRILRTEAPRIAARDAGSPQGDEVRELIHDLPAPLREVLILYYYEGYSYEEIAQLLDIPLGTVKSRMAASLDKIRPMVMRTYHHAV